MSSTKIFSKNLESLSKFNFAIYPYINELDFDNIKDIYEEKTKNNLTTISFKRNEKKYLLHSKYDPIQEAERLVKNVDFERDSLIVVFGIGLGYHLSEIKKRISEDTRVFIIEHNIDVLKYALKNVDFSEIFNTPQFF